MTNYSVGPAFAAGGGGGAGVAKPKTPVSNAMSAPATPGGGFGGGSAGGNMGGPGGNPVHPTFPQSPAPAPVGPAPKPPNIKATVNPQLQAVYQATNKYLKDIREGTGHEMDVMGTKMRDAAEGGRRELMDANAISGRPDATGVGAYDESTQRGVQGALSDVAMRRLGLEGGALGQLETAARTPEEMAIAEKGLGLQAYNSYNSAVQAQNSATSAASNTAFNQMLAVLQAQMAAGNSGGGGGGSYAYAL